MHRARFDHQKEALAANRAASERLEQNGVAPGVVHSWLLALLLQHVAVLYALATSAATSSSSSSSAERAAVLDVLEEGIIRQGGAEDGAYVRKGGGNAR